MQKGAGRKARPRSFQAGHPKTRQLTKTLQRLNPGPRRIFVLLRRPAAAAHRAD